MRGLSKGLDIPESIPRPLPNVWLGVSAEDQKWADIRIPAIAAQTPAAVRFLSAGTTARPDRPEPGAFRLLAVAVLGDRSGVNLVPGRGGWNSDGSGRCGINASTPAVPVFIKQLGAVLGRELSAGSKGNHWDAFPEDLRIREFPATEAAAA